jgi:hypothetical protein
MEENEVFPIEVMRGLVRRTAPSVSPKARRSSSVWKCSTLPTTWSWELDFYKLEWQLRCGTTVEFRCDYLDLDEHAADSVRAQIQLLIGHLGLIGSLVKPKANSTAPGFRYAVRAARVHSNAQTRVN